MKNKDLKSMIHSAGLYQWEIARELGITAGTLTIWLREDPLPDERRQRILAAIKSLSGDDG